MKPKDAQEDRLDLASFVGAVSRWCDLTRNVPAQVPDKSKAKAELEAFTQHLDYLAQKKRRQQQLTF